MVENYFKNLLAKPQDDYKNIDPKIKKPIGIVKLPSEFDMEKAKQEYHREKYGI